MATSTWVFPSVRTGTRPPAPATGTPSGRDFRRLEDTGLSSKHFRHVSRIADCSPPLPRSGVAHGKLDRAALDPAHVTGNGCVLLSPAHV